MKTLLELKNQGVKQVYLNGFRESINYALSLESVEWIGETKSYDGYSMVQCFQTID